MLVWTTVLAVVAAAGQGADASCPTAESVIAELERLGTASAAAAFGRPEVVVRAGRMQVALRSTDGKLAGVRDVAAPTTCPERAAVSATLLSAWVGAWNTGGFPEATRTGSDSRAATTSDTHSAEQLLPSAAPVVADTLAAPATISTAARPVTTSTVVAPKPVRAARIDSPSTDPMAAVTPTAADSAPLVDKPAPAPLVRSTGRRAFEVGAFGFGIHDGDVGGWGGGLQAGYRLPGWLGIDAIFSGTGNRERALPPGSATFRSYGFAIGPSVRAASNHVFGDFGLLPEVTLLTAEGRNYNPGNQVTRWGFSADARLRLGLILGGWRPFVFVAGSFAVRAERLNLEDHTERGIDLSPWNASVGAGLAYLWGSAE